MGFGQDLLRLINFIRFPSEMHLWEGLLLMENTRGIFFSSDLMFRLGKADNMVIEGSWDYEVRNITPTQVPSSEARTALQNTLAGLTPKFVATGHEPCIKVL